MRKVDLLGLKGVVVTPGVSPQLRYNIPEGAKLGLGAYAVESKEKKLYRVYAQDPKTGEPVVVAAITPNVAGISASTVEGVTGTFSQHLYHSYTSDQNVLNSKVTVLAQFEDTVVIASGVYSTTVGKTVTPTDVPLSSITNGVQQAIDTNMSRGFVEGQIIYNLDVPFVSDGVAPSHRYFNISSVRVGGTQADDSYGLAVSLLTEEHGMVHTGLVLAHPQARDDSRTATFFVHDSRKCGKYVLLSDNNNLQLTTLSKVSYDLLKTLDKEAELLNVEYSVSPTLNKVVHSYDDSTREHVVSKIVEPAVLEHTRNHSLPANGFYAPTAVFAARFGGEDMLFIPIAANNLYIANEKALHQINLSKVLDSSIGYIGLKLPEGVSFGDIAKIKIALTAGYPAGVEASSVYPMRMLNTMFLITKNGDVYVAGHHRFVANMKEEGDYHGETAFSISPTEDLASMIEGGADKKTLNMLHGVGLLSFQKVEIPDNIRDAHLFQFSDLFSNIYMAVFEGEKGMYIAAKKLSTEVDLDMPSFSDSYPVKKAEIGAQSGFVFVPGNNILQVATESYATAAASVFIRNENASVADYTYLSVYNPETDKAFILGDPTLLGNPTLGSHGISNVSVYGLAAVVKPGEIENIQSIPNGQADNWLPSMMTMPGRVLGLRNSARLSSFVCRR